MNKLDKTTLNRIWWGSLDEESKYKYIKYNRSYIEDEEIQKIIEENSIMIESIKIEIPYLGKIKTWWINLQMDSTFKENSKCLLADKYGFGMHANLLSWKEISVIYYSEFCILRTKPVNCGTFKIKM
jgi:hypothetical protein